MKNEICNMKWDVLVLQYHVLCTVCSLPKRHGYVYMRDQQVLWTKLWVDIN